MADPSAPAPTRAARHRPPRRTGLIVVLILFLGLVGALAYAGNRYRACREAPEPTRATVTLEVAEGATGEDVAEQLAAEGLTNCGGFVGSLLLRGTGLASDIRAGTYEIPVGITLDDIMVILTTPPEKVPTVELTVPEGLRIRSTFPDERSISSVVADELGLSQARFAKLAESGRYALPPWLPKGTPTAEGFLFPKTFELVKKGLDEEAVIDTMLAQFEKEAAALPWENAEALGLSPYEVVIVASMIEKEAKLDDERALIAGVIYNRLAEPMTLGIDATLLYDDPTPDGSLSTADIETDTPYNTRINAGLPPTPIASPGLASLRAALEPETTDFFYYVLCGDDGRHEFSQTYDQHLANVDACLG
jgi:UPF0755 protein